MAVEVDPSWLTAVLRAAGALPTGEVQAVTLEPTGAFNSHTVRVRARLSPDAPPGLPIRYVVKQNAPAAWAAQAGQDEVRFYQMVAGLADHPASVVPCLAAGIQEDTGDSYLVLVDLSETHRPPLTRDQQLLCALPSDRDIGLVTDALADLHAYWWQRPADHLPVGYWTRDEDRFTAYLNRRRTSWQRVRTTHDWLPDTVVAVYEELLAALPSYWQRHLRMRMAQREALTLVHGDAYFANFLCPRSPDSHDVYLLDWQSPSIDLGAGDLVNLYAPFWTRRQRLDGERERGWLARYHARLCAGGVVGYSVGDLRLDYRRGLVEWVLIAVQDAADGSRVDYWWPKMRRLIEAFQDWECVGLLG
jgi:Ecdysteroid kinase-like family